MTMEGSVYVRIPETLSSEVLALEKRAAASLRRATKLMPGDRTEDIRFESIHAVIDQLASAAIAHGEPSVCSFEAVDDSLRGASVIYGEPAFRQLLPPEVQRWLAAGRVVAEVRMPHFTGETVMDGAPGQGPSSPAMRWTSSSDRSSEAVKERFDFLLSRALEDRDCLEGAIRPSGVSNKVLTESLREYVSKGTDGRPVEVRVIYRDGSEGPRFPMRSLTLTSDKSQGWRTLRFALMSIRHVSMDLEVDGAWLRNSRISRPRPTGMTDQLVFNTSLRQLRSLDPRVPTLICMYQTGLEPAIMGFYRAVVTHLIANPYSIAVLPFYYAGEDSNGKDVFTEGILWRMG